MTTTDNMQESASNSGAGDALPPMGRPIATGLYLHYKGGRYEVLGLVRHSESLQEMVLYRALYGENGLWVRPRAMFESTVEVNGATVARFARVADADGAPSAAAQSIG